MSTKERKHPAPPRYDEAFTAGAVRRVTEQGRPSREVAAELGICIDTLRKMCIRDRAIFVHHHNPAGTFKGLAQKRRYKGNARTFCHIKRF